MEEARAAMLTELTRFADERVGDQELSEGVNYLSGQAEVSRQSAGAVVSEIVDAWLAGEGLCELEACTDAGTSSRAIMVTGSGAAVKRPSPIDHATGRVIDEGMGARSVGGRR